MGETVKGLKKLLDKLNIPPEDIDKIVQANAAEMAQTARRLAPVDQGDLRKSIRKRKIREFEAKVRVGVPYGAYVEFGTGTYVEVPEALQAQASKFQGKGRGSFQEGLDSVRQWCRRNGIPEEAAYPIFMSILRKGVKPQPYIWPALRLQLPRFEKDLERYLTKRFK